ncbi:hypothetical protein [Treponema sp.]|uniref:hypothetical protein n=1 Tax=Treponema sp. TaxID=166 RepID=UPI0025FAA2B1|nr:hypothetical protein [Treponema sp.]MCR5217614.1 hypothetical protein [Treponema sp.]
MNKKLYTGIFVLIATVLNLIFTLLVIIASITLGTLFLRYVLKLPDSSQVYGYVVLGSMIFGIVLAFIVYTKVTTKLIQKYNMDDKFEDNWFGRKKTDKNGKPAAPRKTNMPDSVKLSDEELAEREKWD